MPADTRTVGAMDPSSSFRKGGVTGYAIAAHQYVGLVPPLSRCGGQPRHPW